MAGSSGDSGHVVGLLNKLAAHLMFPPAPSAAGGESAPAKLSHAQQIQVQRKVSYASYLLNSELGRTVERDRMALTQEIVRHRTTPLLTPPSPNRCPPCTD